VTESHELQACKQQASIVSCLGLNLGIELEKASKRVCENDPRKSVDVQLSPRLDLEFVQVLMAEKRLVREWRVKGHRTSDASTSCERRLACTEHTNKNRRQGAGF
jgi:hypothetical protein